MSASTKKQLRKAQEAEKLTEKQLNEQKEAKKLKLYSTIFVVVLAALVLFAAVYGVNQAIANSGIRERNTVAMTIGDQKISNAELSYHYIDAINQFYQNYGSYASMLGLDMTKPLDEQEISEGYTWADDFIASATQSIASIYALNNEAKANGFTLSEENIADIDGTMTTREFYAVYNYGYSDLETYLKAMYGSGASVESYRNYVEMATLAQAYETYYTDSLTYTDEDLRAAEADNYSKYSAFSYNTYYQSVSAFYGEDATEEEIAAAEELAESEVNKLAAGEYASIADFDAAIAAMEINKDNNVTSYNYDGITGSNISATYSEWITDSSRKAGDMTVIANTVTDSEGKETVNGYYVVYFLDSDDNQIALADVRHILVKPEGGSYDSSTGATTYSEEEKAAAKTAAEELYAQWQAGEATEDSFAALANEKSADGDGTTGGLYTKVYPGQMVTNFNDWCFAEGRKAGDTGIVESDYGYHIMFYSGDSNITYRDYLITENLRSTQVTEWFNNLVDSVATTTLDTKYLRTDIVLSSN